MTSASLLCLWLTVCYPDDLPIAEGVHCAAGAYVGPSPGRLIYCWAWERDDVETTTEGEP